MPIEAVVIKLLFEMRSRYKQKLMAHDVKWRYSIVKQIIRISVGNLFRLLANLNGK